MASEDICTCSTVRRAARTLTEHYDRILAPSGVLSTQFSLLRKVADEPRSISALADALALDRTTLGRNLRIMERDRLVKLAPGEDKREKVVTLTPKGRAAFAAALPLWRHAQKTAHQRLQRGERQALFSILGRFDSIA